MPASSDYGYFLKLSRAKEGLDKIASSEAHYIEHELSFTHEIERQGPDQWEVFRWGPVPPIDPMLAVDVGEFVHNVRCALDYVIYEHVVRGGQSGEHSQFPFYDNARNWEKDIIKRDPCLRPSPIQGVPAEVLTIIDSAQPYHLRPKDRPRSPLILLSRLSKVDKHRTLHTAAVNAGPIDELRYVPQGYLRSGKTKTPPQGGSVEYGAEMARVKLTQISPPPEPVKMEIGCNADMVFGPPGKSWIANVSDLVRIRKEAFCIVAELAATL